MSSVTVNNNVTIPTLETLTNKRLQSEQTYTVSSLMTDSANNAGITKESTLIVDLPDYPPTSGQLTLDLKSNTSGTGFTTVDPISEINKDYFSSVRYRVNVPTTFGINYYKYSDSSGTKRKLIKYTTNTNVLVYSGQEIIRMTEDNNTIQISYVLNSGQWTMSISAGTYASIANYSSNGLIRFYDINDNFLFGISDTNNGTDESIIYLSKSIYWIDM